MLPWRLSTTASVLPSAASLQAQSGQHFVAACVIKLPSKRDVTVLLRQLPQPAYAATDLRCAAGTPGAAKKTPQQIQQGAETVPVFGNDTCS